MQIDKQIPGNPDSDEQASRGGGKRKALTGIPAWKYFLQ